MADASVEFESSQLLERVARGDESAESALVQQFAPRIRAMMLARTRDAELARDLTQETLIALLQAARRDQIRDRTRVAAFVHGVARNIVNNHQREARGRIERRVGDDLPEVAVEDDHDARERRELLARGLRELGESDRSILLLTLVEGLKPGEIAARLGLSSEVVRARKSRAYKRIVDALARVSRTPG